MSREAAEQLAATRAAARQRRDFAAADEARDRIAELGFSIVDTADGWQLTELVGAGSAAHAAAPTRTWPSAEADGSPLGVSARILAVIVVNGWRDDADSCVQALLEHEPNSTHIAIITVGDEDAITSWAADVAHAHAQRVTAIHVTAHADHWGAIHRAVISRCASEFLAVVDPATVITGAALTVCCDAIVSGGLAVAGWRGADVDLADEWRSVTASDGEVDVVLSYLMVLPTSIAKTVPPSSRARFYRNADLEWSLLIRRWWRAEYGESARLAAVGDALPATQGRHHGYHDTDPEYREKQSRATYNRILHAFRGHEEILRTR